MSSHTDEEWVSAWDRLQEYRHMYVDIGGAGQFALTLVFAPLIMRYEKGERTLELYDEMMAVE